jgi:hypothetical protein
LNEKAFCGVHDFWVLGKRKEITLNKTYKSIILSINKGLNEFPEFWNIVCCQQTPLLPAPFDRNLNTERLFSFPQIQMKINDAKGSIIIK